MLNNFEINILVVDDTPNNLRFLSAILSQQGYKVHKALNGRLAIMMCQSILPDLILLDIKMPNMNGYEVCQSLKANDKTREIPVIFISALNDVLDKVKAFEVGGVDYITKPFQDAEVLSRIENQLKLRSLQIKLQEQNVALQQEIQERQKAQEALELSETRNRALLNAIPDLMFRISRSGIFLDYRIAKVNESEAAPQRSHQVIVPVTDCLKAEHDFIGKKLSEVLPDDLAIWIMHYVEQTLLTSQIQIGEYVQQVNGNWHAYEARYVKSGNDEVLGLVRDISERKRAEAERLQTQALLRMQKQQIEQALSDLKQAQSQLIQNETMVTLGQLVAGISHEINNPVNFIYGNVTYISEYIQDLISLLELYQQEYPNPAPKVLKKIKDVDLDFVIKDVQNAIDAMYRGAKRIQQIVLSLRNFSRLDESEIKPVDIHEGIDSTLVMLQHRLRETGTHPAIEVIKEYSKLPRVTCYPSQLNQVFLHLLNNAIDALESATQEGSSQLPTIRISTELVAVDTVRIRIADNGCGIPESARSRLFDPFFTTKPVGSGTGLGLSISYQIVVQQHRGKLTCCSSPGQGAEFAIEIPVTPTQ